MILKIKKPDYLGDSMWEMKHENKLISTKILDIEWLKAFQGRRIEVRPGDSIKAEVEIEVKYGYDNEVIKTNYLILRVIEIIQFNPKNQLNLFSTDEE